MLIAWERPKYYKTKLKKVYHNGKPFIISFTIAKDYKRESIASVYASFGATPT